MVEPIPLVYLKFNIPEPNGAPLLYLKFNIHVPEPSGAQYLKNSNIQ